jgi:hypothetical protein
VRSEPQAKQAKAVAQSFHPLNFELPGGGAPVEPCIYSSADAVSATSGWDGACVVVVADVVVIDFIIRAALDAMHTHRDLAWLLAARGREPTTTRRSRTVAKIAKRRIGRPPDGRYGRGVINVPLKTTQ